MKFTITEDHIALLQRMNFDWDDECEWGAVSSDPKRPFGNSDVETDVSEILGREVDHAEAKRLSVELSAIVQAVVYWYSAGEADGPGIGDTLELGWKARRLLGGDS